MATRSKDRTVIAAFALMVGAGYVLAGLAIMFIGGPGRINSILTAFAVGAGLLILGFVLPKAKA